jgi:Cu+-exporting ATPase
MQKNYSCTVEGMTCGNCALSISKLLEKKGATHVAANAASGQVSFSLPEEQDVNTYYKAIDSLGYHVMREGEAEDHEHHNHAETPNILLLICVLLTVPLLAHMFVSWHVLHNHWVQFALATPVFAIGSYVFLPSAYRSLKHGLPNMDVLIVIGATAAYIYSLIGLLFVPDGSNYIFFETAASIITLVMVGNWLEHTTVKSTTVAIDELAKLQPQKARIIMRDSMGKETVIETESRYVRSGDVMLVNTGDSIPADGEIVFGEAAIDEKMITGESVPVSKTIGHEVVGGTIVQQGHLKVKATHVGDNSVLSGIIRMIREAQASKPRLQKLADKISGIFVPAVLGIGILTFIINYFVVHTGVEAAIMRAIAVLVISCPCAMGLATPAAIAVGLGRAARKGILVKGGDTLEQMKTIRQIVFDKTGTLTTGDLRINKVNIYDGMEEEAFKAVVMAIEQHSSHPIAQSVVTQWKAGAREFVMTQVHELKGSGVEATDAEGNKWQLGSAKWLQPQVQDNADLYLFKNGALQGSIAISDTLRPDAVATIQLLKERGYKTILLSGDKASKCQAIAAELGIEEVYAEQSPEQKNQHLERLLQIAPTAMVGDGINDAPALAKATVGISLSESSQIAINSASIILANNHLSTLPMALRLGIYTEQTIRLNLFWAFLYNVLAIPVAACGYLTPTWGAGVMALSDVVLIINSLLLGVRKID